MKRLFLLLMIMVIFFAACSPRANETEVVLTPVNVCYSAQSATQAAAWYAYEKGLFKKYGLQVNLVYISGSTPVTTVISGDMDLCFVASPPVVNAVAAHQDVVMIAGLINIITGSMVAQPEITTPEMLRGKIIGTNMGTNTDTAIRLGLQALNLDPAKDVVFAQIGNGTARATAMQARKIDATFFDPPLPAAIKNKGYVELLNVTKVKIPYQGTDIITTRNYLTGHRSVVKNFMKAILETIVRIKSDPEGSKAVVAQYLSLDPVSDAEILQDTYNVILLDTMEAVPYPTLKGIQTVIDLTAIDNPEAALVKPQDIVDTSILNELDKSGFISSLK